jgi:pimeloyl-ACP methyl ester carboxylesterase
MSSAAANLAVVVCHGSYHTPAPYEPLVQALEARCIKAYCPQRPSCDLSKLNVGDVNHPDFDREPPTGGYPTEADDAHVVIKLLEKLVIDEGRLVLLVAHSSGGWVATEAAQPALQATARKAEGKHGGVIGIFYIGAFIIPVGESVHSFFQPKDGPANTPPFMEFHVSASLS